MNPSYADLIIKAIEDYSFEMKGMDAADKKDARFLKEMIQHHQMALEMSRKMVGSKRLGEFAKGIIDAQSKEIKQMEKWLKEWFDEKPGSSMKM